MPLPLYDITSPYELQSVQQLTARLKATTGGDAEISDAVHTILEDVKAHGDDAVVKYMRKWTNPDFKAEDIRVHPDDMAQALDQLDPALRQAMTRAIDHVRTYESHIKPQDPDPILIDGVELSLRFTPIDRVGLHVPGGRAAYPSTVIMLVTPSQVAGCKQSALVSPPPTIRPGEVAERTDISPLVLAACQLLGQQEVYRIGGAQAIAALAFGTETIQPVDHIVGPGNAFTQEAKRQVFGRVGIDGFFGPSEAVVLVDETCRPDWVASDLIAQAEHDPGCCFVLSTNKSVLEQINQEIDKQLPTRNRQDAIINALNNWSCGILLPDEDAVVEWMDTLAGEHVILATKDPKATLATLSHGGAWFLGSGAPIAAGDYYAGPNHSLPTGTSARFTSGLSVYSFLKRSSVEFYPDGKPSDQAIDDIAAFAEAETLDGHAHSLRIRKG